MGLEKPMVEIGGLSVKVCSGAAVILAVLLVIASGAVSARVDLGQLVVAGRNETSESLRPGFFFTTVLGYLPKSRELLFPHVWPSMEFGWRIIVGTVIAFLGAALGSIGGAGGGGIFVPMLILIIGFDPKSSTAISKCMITGAALATIYFNLRLRHPLLDLPIIDYDLAILLQPMLVLGISVGVFLNVIFPEWMVTVLLIILFMVTSTRAFIKGVETWNLETAMKQEARRRMTLNYSGSEEASFKLLNDGPTNEVPHLKELKATEVSIIYNIHFPKLGILIAIWIVLLLLHVTKGYTATCSMEYWVLTLLQIPVAVGGSGYQAVSFYKGWRVIHSTSGVNINWTVLRLILCCSCGILAGMVGGLLGLGGGFIISPLLLELGIPPQVTSATSTLIMTFSASMSVIQYSLLHRFPRSYALYFVAVAMIAASVGQCTVEKMIKILKRASIVIFILAFVISASAVLLEIWIGIIFTTWLFLLEIIIGLCWAISTIFFCLLSNWVVVFFRIEPPNSLTVSMRATYSPFILMVLFSLGVRKVDNGPLKGKRWTRPSRTMIGFTGFLMLLFRFWQDFNLIIIPSLFKRRVLLLQLGPGHFVT